PDASPWQVEFPLGVQEDVGPQPGFEVTLQLWQIEVGSRTLGEEAAGVVEEEEAEIEQRGRHGPSVHFEVLLDEVPAARPHHEGRRPFAERIRLARAGIDVAYRS